MAAGPVQAQQDPAQVGEKAHARDVNFKANGFSAIEVRLDFGSPAAQTAFMIKRPDAHADGPGKMF
jgi:hypothetical protein